MRKSLYPKDDIDWHMRQEKKEEDLLVLKIVWTHQYDYSKT